MSDDATPRLGLPYLAAAQAQKHVTMNEAMALLDGFVACAAESRTLAAQPASPPDGAMYVLPAGATGADWAGRAAGTVMRFEAGAWRPLATTRGQILLVADEVELLVRTAGGWTDLAAILGSLDNLAHLGIATNADATNVLSVRGLAALFSHAGAGVQVKMNKNSAADTASLLYQTGFSGRAEVGLCGDDRLHVKVSPDGSAWTEAMTVESATGRVGLGVTATSRLHVDGAVRVKSYAKASLPSAGGEGPGAMIYVSDDVAGPTLAFSDGAAWRRVHDRAVVA